MIVVPNSISMFISRLFSGSRSVEDEVLKRLPDTIEFELRVEFDSENNPVIFAKAPEYEGLFTEGKDLQETLNHCCDAVLTYFDVPREYANLVEYAHRDVRDDSGLLPEQDSQVSLKNVVLDKQLACA